MDVQRWLLHNVITATRVHSASYAYQQGRSIVDCAARHVGSRYLIKLDIHNFFRSIDEAQVFRVIRRLGYPDLICLELARLCTRIPDAQLVRREHHRYEGKAPYAVDQLGYLPQGAPTSGMLANSVMFHVDDLLSTMADRRGLLYTRYSDDLVFSAGTALPRRTAADVVNEVSNVLEGSGFKLHRKKTKFVGPGSRRIVLGLLVTDSQVRLMPEYKRRVEMSIRGVERFGLVSHAAHRGFDSALSFVSHVDGRIAFAAGVEPTFATAVREAWNSALESAGYPVSA
jgi:hypothetical protein